MKVSTPNKNYLFIHENISKHRTLLLQGGMRSGKTWSVLYYIVYMCLNYSGIEIDCVRETNVAARFVLMEDFLKILIKHGIYRDGMKNYQTFQINGNKINFLGCDLTTKVYGKDRDILFVNEAQLISEDAIQQLLPRTKHKVIIDFNPALYHDHWLFSFINNQEIPRVVSTYRDNPFLPASQVAEIESMQKNEYWWKVYGCGEVVLPQGMVFSRFSRGDFPTHLQYVFGADFGFVKDPTALVKVAVDKKERKIYVCEEIYDIGNLRGTDDIHAAFARIAGNALIIGDAHGQQQRIIFDLRKKGLNIVECRYDSVIAGVMEMMNYEIVLCGTCENIYRELTRYCWVDKGKSILSDAYNHAIDAIRYAFTFLAGQGSYDGNYVAKSVSSFKIR